MKPRPITSMKTLQPEQLRQVADWLEDGLTLEKVSTLIEQEFHAHVSVTSLHRFHQRLTIQYAEETRPELAEAALSWLKFAATGEVDFSAATLELIKQQIFQLVATQGDPDRLKFLFNILFTTQRETTRQRHAAVAEIRAQAATDRNLLAERNLALKFELAGMGYNDALNKESAIRRTPNIIPEWGPILRALEEENRRGNQPVTATNKAPAASAPAPEPVNPAPDPIAPASEPAPEPALELAPSPEPQPAEPSTLPTPEDSASPNSDPVLEPADPIISETHPAEPPSLSPTEEPSAQPEEAAEQTQPDSDSDADEQTFDPESRPHPRPNAPTLGERIQAYVHARRLEELELRRTHPNSYYWTRYNCCPCGLKLPCLDHGPLPFNLKTNPPDTHPFNDAMRRLFPEENLEPLLSPYSPLEFAG